MSVLIKLVLNALLAFVIVLAIGQFQIMYQIRFSHEVDIVSGIPFTYYFFAKNCQFDLHGFNIYHFFYDFMITWTLVFLFSFIAKRAMSIR